MLTLDRFNFIKEASEEILYVALIKELQMHNYGVKFCSKNTEEIVRLYKIITSWEQGTLTNSWVTNYVSERQLETIYSQINKYSNV